MKKLTAWILIACLLGAMGAAGYASSAEASGETAAQDDGPKAIVVLTDEGEDPDAEQTEGYTLRFFDGGARSDTGMSGFVCEADNLATALYYSELTEESGEGFTYVLGGTATENVAVEEKIADDSPLAPYVTNLEGFDSVVELGCEESADSCEPVISAKGWTCLKIQGVYMLARGAARSAFYSDVAGGSTVPGAGGGGMSSGTQEPVVVVSDSVLITTGGVEDEDAEAQELRVMNTGVRARGIQPQGKSYTYLYNSVIESATWGAWSTDSARQTLELVAYDSVGYSDAGYGAYADTSCHLFLYGSTLIGGTDGVTASNDGEIYCVASDWEEDSAALSARMDKTPSRTVSPADYYDESYDALPAQDSAILGGQCAVQFHMPDQSHSGAQNTKKATLYMNGGLLATQEELIPAEMSAYTARYAGACIVTKSTQGSILLEGTAMESWSGELIHTMINSDSNVNDIADGDEAPGSDVTLRDMTVAGDIVNDDYQRALRLTLDGTELTGAIVSHSCEDWNAFCEAELEGEYILNPDGYETVWGVEVTLTNGAVWNVTETSVVTALNIGEGCSVNGAVSVNPDGTWTISPIADASGEMEFVIDGGELGSFSLSGAEIGEGYRFSLGTILGLFGVDAEYDEQNGTLTLDLGESSLEDFLGGLLQSGE